MKIKIVEIDKVIPYERNPRRNEKAIDGVAASIKAYGWQQPIVVDAHMVILAGHTRLQAAKKLGLETVPVHIAKDLTAAEAKAYRLADNKVSEAAEWDPELLKLEIDDLQLEGFDLELTGFTADDIEKMLANAVTVLPPGEAPEETASADLPNITQSTEGDLYEIGEHRLLCGDSLNVLDVDKLMDGHQANMIFTDPPYGMRLDTDWSDAKTSKELSNAKGIRGGNKYRPVKGDDEDFDPSFLLEYFKKVKEQFWWGADYYAERLPEKNDGSWIVWDKRLEESADKMYGSCFELCWSKNKHKRDIARVKWAGVFGTEKEPDKKRHHPTQKPVELVKWFFERWGSRGDLVVDLFGGSGATMIGAHQSGRKAYLMEMDPGYCDGIVKRMHKLYPDLVIRRNGKVMEFNDDNDVTDK